RRHTRSKRDWSSDVCSSDLRGSSHNSRNLLICSVGTFALFFIGSSTVLLVLESTSRVLPRNAQLGILTLALSATLAVVVSLIGIPIGFAYMYFFGGVVSTKAIKLYLFITKGTHVISSKASELAAVQASRGLKLKLRRRSEERRVGKEGRYEGLMCE